MYILTTFGVCIIVFNVDYWPITIGQSVSHYLTEDVQCYNKHKQYSLCYLELSSLGHYLLKKYRMKIMLSSKGASLCRKA